MPNNYLHFSRRERIGIAALLGLTILLYMVPPAWEWWRRDEEILDSAAFHKTVAALEVMMKADTIERENYAYKKYELRYKTFLPFKKDSLRYFEKHFEKKPRYERITSLDINAADTALWNRLPGIGPVLSRRIVAFRERLGGFHSVVQVGETFGLADSVFVKIQPLLQLGSGSLRKIDLNHTDEKSLADHPYIDTKLARTIIRYRSIHGPFRAPEELKGIPLVDDVIYRKIEKYLVVK